MISFTNITKQSNGAWRFFWAESGTFRIVFQGKEIDTTTDSFVDVYIPSYTSTPPPIEVVADGDYAVSERNLPYMLLQWNRIDTDPPVTHYDIEWGNGASWSHVTTVAQADTVQVYTYVSNILADQTEFQMRAVPVNNERREGDAQRFTAYVVRRPNVPDLEAACSGGVLTIQ
jgi:hypothetical protein